MKKLLLILGLFYCMTAAAQSPGLTAHLRMDPVESGSIQFKIEMKICKPLKTTEVKDYLTNDSSTLDFKALTEKDMLCRRYMGNSAGADSFYHYYFSNQVFAWEKFMIWKITNISSRGVVDPMYVIMPVKLKSFVTFIEVNDVPFEDGRFIWIDQEGKIEPDRKQHISVSLKNRKGVNVDKSLLKALLN